MPHENEELQEEPAPSLMVDLPLASTSHGAEADGEVIRADGN